MIVVLSTSDLVPSLASNVLNSLSSARRGEGNVVVPSSLSRREGNWLLQIIHIELLPPRLVATGDQSRENQVKQLFGSCQLLLRWHEASGRAERIAKRKTRGGRHGRLDKRGKGPLSTLINANTAEQTD